MGLSYLVVCSDYWTNLLFDVTTLLLKTLAWTFLFEQLTSTFAQSKMSKIQIYKTSIMKNKIIKLITLCSLVFCLQLTTTTAVQAQCPMCKMSAESNLKNGGTDGQGLNKGILYMLATPYLIVFGLGYFWWRNRKKEEELELEENIHLN